MSEDLRESVIQRVLSTVLQQKVITELDDVNVSSSVTYDPLLKRTANDGLMKPDVARRVLAFFTFYLREQKEHVCSCRHRKNSRPSQLTLSDVERVRPAKVNGKQ